MAAHLTRQQLLRTVVASSVIGAAATSGQAAEPGADRARADAADAILQSTLANFEMVRRVAFSDAVEPAVIFNPVRSGRR